MVAKQSNSEPDPQSPEGIEELDAIGRALLARVAERDLEAFSELYDRFSGILYSIVLRVGGQRIDPDDVMQEAFVKIWERASRYDPEAGRPATWMITVTRNTAIDKLRSEGRRESLREKSTLESELTAPPAFNPVLDDVSDGEESHLLQKALDLLTPNQRVALHLAYFDGLTQTEIAEKLGEPLGTIKGRIRRGIVCLRRVLAHQYPDLRKS